MGSIFTVTTWILWMNLEDLCKVDGNVPIAWIHGLPRRILHCKGSGITYTRVGKLTGRSRKENVIVPRDCWPTLSNPWIDKEEFSRELGSILI